MAGTKLHRAPHRGACQFWPRRMQELENHETQFVAESRVFVIAVQLKYHQKISKTNKLGSLDEGCPAGWDSRRYTAYPLGATEATAPSSSNAPRGAERTQKPQSMASAAKLQVGGARPPSCDRSGVRRPAGLERHDRGRHSVSCRERPKISCPSWQCPRPRGAAAIASGGSFKPLGQAGPRRRSVVGGDCLGRITP